jgi:hypothetical protein
VFLIIAIVTIIFTAFIPIFLGLILVFVLIIWWIFLATLN